MQKDRNFNRGLISVFSSYISRALHTLPLKLNRRKRCRRISRHWGICMDAIKERVLTLGEYIRDTHATVRETAHRFGVSKSTVHKDMTLKLSHYDTALYAAVRAVLEENKAERHLRGGEATKQKYLQKRKDTQTIESC